MRFVLLLLLCICQASFAQGPESGRVFGKITVSGAALPGVTVMLKGTTRGAATDLQGQFEITGVASGRYRLVASYIGYRSSEIDVLVTPGEALEVNINLTEEVVELDQVEVIAKSVSDEVNAQAYTVSAVSARELSNSIADAKGILNRIPGVRILEEGGLGSDLTFSLNGFSGDQVKFFLNGIPMDNFGSSLGLSSIPVNSIQRVEVYKGVVPVWLGTDALGGAVNIVTNEDGNFFDASYATGSFNTHRISLNGSRTNRNGITVRGTLNYNYSDNDYEVRVPLTDPVGNVLGQVNAKRFHDAYRSGMASFEAGVINKEYADELLVGAIVSGDEKEVQNGATMARAYGGIMQQSKSLIPSLKYNKENLLFDGLDVSLRSALNITQMQNIDTLRGVYYNWLGEAIPANGEEGENGETNHITMDNLEFTNQLNLGYEITPKHSLAFNYAFQYFYRETFDSEHPNNIANQFPNTLNKHVLGLAYKFDYNSRWSTTVFGKAYILNVATSKEYDFGEETRRTDVYEATKENVGYGIATSYFLLPKLQLKSSYEHTFRMPWANEIFGNGLFVQPNADLGPERSDNFNFGASFGLDLTPDHRFTIESGLAYRNARDLIYQVVTVATPETSYSNLAEVRTIGVEGAINYQWKWLLNIGANVTYQNITDQADFVFNDYAGYQRNFNKGFRLPNTPYLFGNARVGATFHDVFTKSSTLAINYFYNFNEEYFLSWAKYGSKDSKKVIPQQSSHNVELTYSLSDGKYNLGLECRNITDEALYDKFYLQKPGRAFYVKLRYVVGK